LKRIALATLAAVVILQSACTTTKQHAAADFRPPTGKYSVVVMRPDVNVSLLTAGGQLEPREDWTKQARANVLAELQRQQAARGGNVVIAHSVNDANTADVTLVTQLDRLHEAVGRSIRIHKYTPGMELPTKKNSFDWTLGQLAIDYGNSSGYDYALFLFADGSFSSGGRVALQVSACSAVSLESALCLPEALKWLLCRSSI
jgi:hypothetical protein